MREVGAVRVRAVRRFSRTLFSGGGGRRLEIWKDEICSARGVVHAVQFSHIGIAGG